MGDVADDGRKVKLKKEHQKADDDGNHVDIGQDFFQGKLWTAADEGCAVGPDEEVLNCNEGAGVNHPLFAKYRGDERNDEIAGVGVDQRSLFDPVKRKDFSQKRRKDEENQMNQECSEQRQQEAVSDFIGIGNLKCLENDTGQNDVNADDGETFGCVRTAEMCPHKHGAQHHHDEKFCQLSGERDCDHNPCILSCGRLQRPRFYYTTSGVRVPRSSSAVL